MAHDNGMYAGMYKTAGEVLGGAQADKETTMCNIMSQLTALRVHAGDLYQRLNRMDVRINGNRPTPISDAKPNTLNAASPGLRFDIGSTLQDIQNIMSDCHSTLQSLEEFV